MPNKYKVKVCATCGKAEGKNWAQHWKDIHPGKQSVALQPGQAPTHPLDTNWLYLIKDTATRELFLKATNPFLPPTQANHQLNTTINQPLVPQPMQQHPEDNQQTSQTEQGHIKQIEEDKQQEKNVLDYSSTPTQDLFMIAETSLQAIQERLIAKQSALGDHLSATLKNNEHQESIYVRHIYHTQGGCHLAMTRVLSYEQVDTSIGLSEVTSIQCSQKISMNPESRKQMNRIIKEQERVRTQTMELESAIKSVKMISLPSDLTLNNCHAEVNLAERHLSKRQKKLLRQPQQQPTPTPIQHPRPPHNIQLTHEEEKAIEHPYFYGTALDRLQDQPEGPVPIDICTYDIGDDLMKGINDIDGARDVVTKSRQKVLEMQYSSTLRQRLLMLILDMRRYMGRKLQGFVNMLLIPHPKVGLGTTEVLLLFNNPFMKDRTFTVNVTRQGRRAFNQTSTEFLNSIEKGINIIANTACAIMDFTEALDQVKFEEEEAVFLEPLMKDVLNAVRATTGDVRMRRMHRMKSLQSVLKTVTARLYENNLLINLIDEQSMAKFMATATIKEIVQWQTKRHQ